MILQQVWVQPQHQKAPFYSNRTITSDFRGTEPCMRDIFFCAFHLLDPLEGEEAIHFHQCMKHPGKGLLPTASVALHRTPCMCCLILVPCNHILRRRRSYKTFMHISNIQQLSINILINHTRKKNNTKGKRKERYQQLGSTTDWSLEGSLQSFHPSEATRSAMYVLEKTTVAQAPQALPSHTLPVPPITHFTKENPVFSSTDCLP